MWFHTRKVSQAKVKRRVKLRSFISCPFSCIIPPLEGRLGLPWYLRWLRILLQCRRPGFSPCVSKIPWRRAWQPTPVFLPGKFHSVEIDPKHRLRDQAKHGFQILPTQTEFFMNYMNLYYFHRSFISFQTKKLTYELK